MTQLFAAEGGTYNPELGEFVNDVHVHLAAIIHDYKPTLSLVYIPKKDQSGFEKPWAIVEKDPRFQKESIIRYISTEEMKNPAAIPAWLFEGDQDKHGKNHVLERIENQVRAQQLLELKRQEEELEDMIDHVEFFVSGGREKLHTIRFDKHTKVERG